MADLTTLTTRLAEAEDALHLLMMGRQVTSSAFQDQRASFAAMSRADLEAYIARLKLQIARLEGAPSGPLELVL